jgi:hypothetical protein
MPTTALGPVLALTKGRPVKNLNKLILGFGVLGLVAMFIPQGGASLFSLFKFLGTGQLVIMLAAFGVPTVMGVMSLKAPLQKWQAGASIAGFGLGCFKLEVWKSVAHIGELFKAFPMLLIVVAAIGGLVVSILAMVKTAK